MIYAFTGKTGSGKTFNMIRLAYRHWLSGTDIYSNTILMFKNTKIGTVEKIFHYLWYVTTLKIIREPYKAKKRGRIIYFEDISEILEARNGLILFDEAQVLFSARQWESLPMEFTYKLQQHRKHRLDLYCTTQNMGTIDIMYRRLVQRWFHHRVIFQIGESPVNLGLFKIEEKDVDMLYNSVDDLLVDTIKTKLFIIHRFKKRLYDTFYDIGFKAFKTLWLSSLDEKTNRFKGIAWIIPKEITIQQAQTIYKQETQTFQKREQKFA